MGGNKKSRSGFLFMIIIVALLGIIFFAYKDKFMVLLNTGFSSGKEFFDKKLTKNEEDNNLITEKIDLLDEEDRGKIRDQVISNFENVRDEIKDIIKSDGVEKVLEKKKEEITEKLNENKENKTKNTQNETTKEEKINSRKSQLYFSALQGDASLQLVSVPRTITFTNTPLTETLKALLSGPSSTETASEIITNIPNDTKLLSVSIKNGVAYVNFSKEFEYNSYGRESTVAQIKQVVYTVTEFTNVKFVQFMINGQIKTYLGGEGVIINKPLSRNDFS